MSVVVDNSQLFWNKFAIFYLLIYFCAYRKKFQFELYVPPELIQKIV